jgi:hypothetical protein
MEMTSVLGSLLGSTVGKIVAGAVGIAAVGAVIYILMLQGQVKDRDLAVARQQAMIQAQAQRIEALDLQYKLTQSANDTLNERLKVREIQVDNLNAEIEDILKQGAENDGPVAPILDSVVRAPAAGPRR